MPTSWAWDFESDGVIDSIEKNRVHVFPAAGTYTVKLNVSNSAGSDESNQTIRVNEAPSPPDADFTAAPQTGEKPLAVTFNDTSTGTAITEYRWIFSDNPGTVFTDRNLTHTFANAGIYDVNHSVTNDGGTGWRNETGLIVVTNTPAITALSPKKKTAGSPAFVLTVKGTNFTSSSIVQWNGSNRTTAFVSPVKVTAMIKAKNVKKKGQKPVTVVNPGLAGGFSNSKMFKVI
jgi:PKD repeat protein